MSKTVKQIIDYVDEIKPNAFTPARKVAWLNELEGRIQIRVFLQDSVEVVQYDWTEDQNTQVLVDPPYDRLYELFLAAMIDYAHGEYALYQNSMAAFNELMGEFTRFFADRYHPADGNIGGI